ALRGDAAAVRHWAGATLAEPLSVLGGLTPATVQRCLLRAWRAATAALPEGDAARERLETAITLGGFATDEVWEAIRRRSPAARVGHFVVTALQPLGDEWADAPFRRPGQEGWAGYVVRYGVLAADADAAAAAVVARQARGHPVAAEIRLVEPEPGAYNDHPGVTARSWPAPEGDDAADGPG
ncbi:MAG TPA: hypothetical protein VF796_16565, partial [Humisphaera sp.]